jgi:hypothetical protein
MSDIHTFVRPEAEGDTRKIGDAYIDGLDRYDEGARYTYHLGAHDLALFWTSPSAAEIAGFRSQPIEVGLYQNGPAAFLLYKIDQVCEWSDVAFNVKRLPEAERQLPDEPTGERARFRLTLVDTDSGLVKAKRLVSLDKVMTQALRHAMREQAAQPFNQTLYDIAVQETYARFPDTDALVRAAELVEATHG